MGDIGNLILLVGCSAVAGVFFLAMILSINGQSPRQIKQQAFDRGFMIECVGKSGYYWECE